MRVAFHHGGKKGTLEYRDGDVLVSHPDPRICKRVHDYLTNDHDFKIHASTDPHVVGSMMRVTKKPTESSMWMELAVNEMHTNTGAWVDWGDPDNRGDNDPNAEADKPILRSLDDFDIIN